METETVLFLLIGILLLSGAAIVALAWKGRGHEDGWGLALARLFTVTYCRAVHRYRVEGPDGDPIPREGRFILVANHRSGVDPVILTVITLRRVRFLMAEEYYALPVLNRLFRALRCIPVNRDGSDLGATKAALQSLRAGEVIGIFPQGGIHDAQADLEGKSGVGLLALRSGAPVIPVLIEGSPNYHSVFRSMVTPSRTVVHVGEPLEFSRVGGSKASRADVERVTSEVMEAITRMKSRGET